MPAIETVIVTLGVAIAGIAIGGLIGAVIGRAIYGSPIKFEGPSDDEPPVGDGSTIGRWPK